MFDFVQERKRLVQIVLLLIILPFAFFGVDSYNKASKVTALASVNDAEITAEEFDNGMRQQQDRMRQMLGANFDASLFENPEIKKAVLDSLVAQKLLLERAKSAGLTVTDDQIAQIVGNIEAFQTEGKFDKKRYAEVLSNKNMSPLMFEAKVRDDLLAQQLRDIFAQNGFTAHHTADTIIRLNEQQRLVAVSPLSFQAFLAQVNIAEAAVKQYYDKNGKEFELPEQAKVEYVKFSVENLLPKMEVTEAELQKYYQEHSKELGTPEQRHAAHILISAAANAPQTERDAAKAKAEQLLKQVKSAPDSFADVAKQHSQDPGSAANGGDLGFFGQGQMVKPFEAATFALKTGEISALVQSDFGYHIIKLLEVKAAHVPSFEETRPTILVKLREQKATEKFTELAEKFGNTVYEQSDTLKSAAELVGAPIEQSGWLAKGAASSELWSDKMLQVVFSDEVLKNKRNSPAVEVAANTLVAARLLEHKPASLRPFGEVQTMIVEKLKYKQAVALAVQQGKTQLAELQKGATAAVQWSDVQTVSRAQHSNLDAALLRQVFQVNSGKLPQIVGAETSEGFMLVRVDAVKAGDPPDEAKRLGYVKQLRQMMGEEIYRAYINDAKQRAKIKTNLPETTTAKP